MNNSSDFSEWFEEIPKHGKESISHGSKVKIIHDDNFNNNEILSAVSIWLLEVLTDSNISNQEEFEKAIFDLEINFPKNGNVWDYFKSNMDKIGFQIKNSTDEYLQNDVFGSILQQSLTKDERKIFAANYTTLSSSKILISFFDDKSGKIKSVCDPFCGSGRLITTYLKKISNDDGMPLIRLNDKMPLASIIAYARVVREFKIKNEDFSKIIVTIGDAFANLQNEISYYDLVLTNPPFTRTHRIDDMQKEKMKNINNRFDAFLEGQPGLHIYGLFLSHLILKENGHLGTVLPATTFSSDYSDGYKNFLINNYANTSIISSENSKSFSEDSDFNEIMLIAMKNISEKNEFIDFIKVTEDRSNENWNLMYSNKIDVNFLQSQKNWIANFVDPVIHELNLKLINSNIIYTGKQLKLKIIRGVEMYGPDYFFIPNTEWEIEKNTSNFIHINSKDIKIKIPKEYLELSLRKPGLYQGGIIPDVNEYLLKLPLSLISSNPDWLNQYNHVTQGYASPARKKYSDKWMNHILHQLEVKYPFGHLFFIDKFSISGTSVLCHYSDQKLTCSKNFYVLKNFDKLDSKIMAAWINSSLYLFLFLINRREIGGSYGRMQISDLKNSQLFININSINSELKIKIENQFNKLLVDQLPPLPDQIGMKIRKDLDLLFLDALNFSDEKDKLLEILYRCINDIFNGLIKRDKSRSTKL